MRLIFSVLVSVALIFGYGCAPSHSTLDVSSPLFGSGHVGVDIGADGQPVITGGIGLPVAGTTKAIDQCGNVRTVTRAVDECGNTRAIAPAYRQIDVLSVCGRGWTPYVNAVRGVGTRDPREIAREVVATECDLKRELHNAKVARDYTIERSMWSAIRGFFGFHRKICPLDQSLQPSPVVISTSPQVGEILPEPTQPNIGLPPSGIVPPPDTKSVSNFEARVGSLEYQFKELNAKQIQQERRVLQIGDDIEKLNIAIGNQGKDIKDILAAIAPKK